VLGRIWIGVASGALAGSLVGLGEALYVLGGADTGEYVAFVYGAVLYGIIGMAMGGGIGVGLAILGKIWKGLSHELAWALAFVGVITPLGLVIARYVVNKAVFQEGGVPTTWMLGMLVAFGLNALLDLWLVPVFLKRTPLKVLLGVKGGIASWLALVALAAIFSFAPGSAGADGEMAPAKGISEALSDKPDVVLVVVDTLRADHLGTYGNDQGLTPALDDFADDAVVFEQYITHASWTRASFASLYTSMLPSCHNCILKVEQLPDDVETLAEAMNAHGYVTGGLPNNINVTRSFNFQQGFDYFSYQSPSYIAGATESAAQLSMYNVVRKLRDKVAGDARRVEDYYQPAETVLGVARNFISANQTVQNRSMLVVHLMEPHDPYFAHPYDGSAVGRAWHPNPDPSEADSLRSLYRGEVQHLDQQLGEFLGWMKEQGLYDDTLIVLTADHGEEFHEHGGWWHGITLYEEQVHVPLIMKLPKGELAGSRVPWQVRQMDVTPTIAELTGAPASGLWQGRSLFGDDERAALAALAAPPPPPVEDDSEDEAGEGTDDANAVEDAEGADAVEEVAAPAGPDLEALARLMVSEQNFEGNDLGAVRKGTWKYIRANEGNPRGLDVDELYDLSVDPHEQNNLAGREGAAQAELSRILRETIEATQEGGCVDKQETEISCEECEKLLMLGYMSDCTDACGG